MQRLFLGLAAALLGISLASCMKADEPELVHHVRGFAIADDPLVGASVTLTTLDGSPLSHVAPAMTNEHGAFIVRTAALPARYAVVATGGSYRGRPFAGSLVTALAGFCRRRDWPAPTSPMCNLNWTPSTMSWGCSPARSSCSAPSWRATPTVVGDVGEFITPCFKSADGLRSCLLSQGWGSSTTVDGVKTSTDFYGPGDIYFWYDANMEWCINGDCGYWMYGVINYDGQSWWPVCAGCDAGLLLYRNLDSGEIYWRN